MRHTLGPVQRTTTVLLSDVTETDLLSIMTLIEFGTKAIEEKTKGMSRISGYRRETTDALTAAVKAATGALVDDEEKPRAAG